MQDRARAEERHPSSDEGDGMASVKGQDGGQSRPILFSAPMVRAILEGRKTQTRRLVKPSPVDIVSFKGRDNELTGEYGLCFHPKVISKHARCPYGRPGDRLWVRETWRSHHHRLDLKTCEIDYRADSAVRKVNLGGWTLMVDEERAQRMTGWRPSIHMPHWASRIALEVTGVRVERLQEISEADVGAEGVEFVPSYGYKGVNGNYGRPQYAFQSLWESIHGPGSWEANPFVWAVSFKVI